MRGPRKRIDALCSIAALLADEELVVDVGRDLLELRKDLLALPGVGAWTTDYIVMRLFNAPDILLTGDLALRKGAAKLGIDGVPALTEHAQNWRPWRSYAGMHLWRASSQSESSSSFN